MNKKASIWVWVLILLIVLVVLLIVVFLIFGNFIEEGFSIKGEGADSESGNLEEGIGKNSESEEGNIPILPELPG